MRYTLPYMALHRSLEILQAIDARVADRCAATTSDHPDWPCAAGCDARCRSLPHLPTVTLAEWRRLAAAIDALPAPIRTHVREGILRPGLSAPVTCPLLDADRGLCRTYDARPVACRTYGFYTERDAGLHCAEVARRAEGREVVWGNGEAVARDLAPLGEARSLAEWLQRDP